MTLIRRYPLVIATLAVALVTLGVLLSPAAANAGWVASVFALVIAGRSAISMVRSLRRGTWGIDILAVAAIISTVALGDYWASLVVVLMIVSGEALEDFASRRARSELTALMSRAPRIAHREDAAGDVDDVAIDAVAISDILEVRPGEAIPVDAAMLGDGATLDESSITGESMPVWRGPGAALLSGAVNGDGVIRVRATASAKDSQYQTIIELVRAAADSKAPFVRLADRVAIPFTAAAFLIGGLAWALSGEPARFAEVLVVATPCPLLIAAPVAFVAGMSRAARLGVIVKNGGVLEQLSRIKTVAFDKTGTLTQGTPIVTRVESVLESDDAIVSAMAALESDSTHVLAHAVVTEADRRGLDPREATDVEEVIGHGVRGVLDGSTLAVGKLSFVDANAKPTWGALAPGEMAIYVSRDGALLGRVVLTDELRPETRETLEALRALGVTRTVMLTGDAVETAEKIGALAGITEVRAALLPAEKVAAITSLTPAPVMMVGDGVNDAPVLAAAAVGVAMGARGATAASESADVVIMVEDLSKTATVIQVSQRTLRIARQSIAVGIGLSLVLMGVASFGLLPAILGAALQEVIDVVAIVNSLRAGRGDAPVTSRAAEPSRQPHPQA